ncbi:dTDP-glucose 4,6-dehydratase [Desulfovibrio inopinatus]|uniref:dTDP-glucose 4,6-dehydratase n=1 Tax=Desulfovibrio inopinatus TaxID=102109 RepID=UPI0003FE962F|nr:dTDP-glucose 4,6-dehydratase [Desulfovibrio inopinatus]
MRLLVTGGCGFIGANYIHLVMREQPEDVIVNLDKLTYAGNPENMVDIEREFGGERYFFVQGDIGNVELVSHILRTHKIDAVVNFAAESHVDRSIDDCSPFIETNVVGTKNLLEASRKYGVDRFVHVSTDEVYGTLGEDGQFSEESPLAPNSPYSASKASSDMLCRAFFETHDFPVVITRCSNNYGPYQFPEKLIPLMYSKAKGGESLPVYGDGQNVRDWIYVADHCRGVDLALRKGRLGAVYNFGGAAEMKNIDVVKTILSALGKSEDLITYVKDRPGHDRRYAMNFDLAAKELGFAPSLNFAAGIQETIDWYEQNSAWLEGVESGAYRSFMNRWYGERS